MLGILSALFFLMAGFVVEPVCGSPLIIEPDLREINLTHSSQVLEDPLGKLTIEEITRSPWADLFSVHKGSGNNLGVTRSAFWIRVDMLFPGDYTGRYLLELPYPSLDEVTAYLPDGKGGLRVVETGDGKPFAQREVDNHDFVFRLPAKLQGRTTIHVRVANQGAIIAPLHLWKEQAFFENEQTESLVSGIYYGVLIALAIFNLFIYFSVRDASYLWYVGYLSGMGMFLFIYKGLAYRYFWPDFPQWGNHALYVSVAVALFCGLGFMRVMLNLSTLAPRLNTLIFWTGCGMALYPLFGFVFGKYFLIAILPYLGLLTLAFALASITLSIRGGYKPAWFVGISFIALLPGALLLPLRTLGVVPDNPLTANSLQFGVAAEALLLSFALAYRIRLLNAEITQTHKSMIEAKKDFTRKLIGARDTELRRIASELHDGIGQNLLVLSNRLRGLHKQTGSPLLKEKFRFLLDIVQETINDIRRMSRRLHPHQLERLGLKAALEETIKRSFEDTAIQADFRVDDLQHVEDPAIKLHVYRIVQESIKNIVVHSNASRAYIEVTHGSGNISIWIEDNGDGVVNSTYVEDTQTPSFGLTSIKERVQLLNGKLEFKSTEKSGFLLSVTLPIPPKKVDT